MNLLIEIYVLVGLLISCAILLFLVLLLPRETRRHRVIVLFFSVSSVFLVLQLCLISATILQLFLFGGTKTANVEAPVPASTRYVTTGLTAQDQEMIIARNGQNGSTAWTYTLKQRQLADDGIPLVTIGTDKNIVYALWEMRGSTTFTMMALRELDGSVLWSTAYQRHITTDSQCNADLQSIGALLVVNNLVYVLMGCRLNDNFPGLLYAFHVQNGTLAWQKTLLVSFNETSALTAADGLLFIGGNNIRALHANDGSIAWISPIGVGRSRRLGVYGNMVYVFDKSGFVWPLRVLNGAYCPASLHAIELYPADNTCYPIIRNGYSKEYRRVYRGIILSAIAASGSTLYISGYQFNEQYIFAVNSSNGRVYWKRFIGTKYGGEHIVVLGNNLYFSEGLSLYALRSSDGMQLWHTTMFSLVYYSLTIDHGVLFADMERFIERFEYCLINCEPEAGLFAINATNGDIYWHP